MTESVRRVASVMHYVVNVIAYVTVYTLVLVAILRYMTIVRDNETTRCVDQLSPKQLIVHIALCHLIRLINNNILYIYFIKRRIKPHVAQQ